MIQNDIITLGKLSWRVLTVENDKALLLCEKALSSMQPYKDATFANCDNLSYKWSDCDINKYLNDEFLFKYKLLSAPIASIPHETEATSFVPSEITDERVFLLSATEVEKYLPQKEDRKAYKNSRSACSWWLRSPGLNEPNRLAYVEIWPVGRIYYIGGKVACAHSIRPAIWINV
jgi:hypothetical protein